MRKFNRILLIVAAFTAVATFATGCSVKAKVARHEKRADAYFAVGDYSKAEIEYLNALRLAPENVHNLARLGMVYYEQGRMNRAYAFIHKASTLATNDIDLHVKLASIYLGALKIKEARDEAGWVLDRSPTNGEAIIIFAKAVTSRTGLEEAQKRVEKLSKQIGETAPLDVALGVLHFRADDSKAAESALKRALVLDPKCSDAYFALGSLYAAQNQLTNAAVALKAASDFAPARSMTRLAYASFKIQTGDLTEGKRLLAEISKEAPDYVPALIRQAEIALVEKRFDDCASLLNETVARDPDNYDALLLRGRSFIEQGQGDKAVTEMERMATLYDRSSKVHYYLAVAHLAVNDTAKANADLNKALFLEPGYPDATVLLAGLEISKGDASSAIPSLTQLITKEPGIYQAHLLLANAYLVQKNPDQALMVYSKMAELFPQFPQVPFLTGMLLVQQKKLSEARNAFEKALAMSPHFVVALEQLVDLDISEGKFDSALDRINKQIDNDRDVTRQLLLAKVYIARARNLASKDAKPNPARPKLDVPAAQDDINQAEAALQKAIELDPNLPTPYFFLAQLYVNAGKEQEALTRLNGLVSKTNNATAYMQIGMIYDTLKNYPAARDAYEKVLAINPNSDPALNNLSYLYSEHLGQIEKAYALAEKAHELSPRDPATADTLGWILYKKRDYQRALGLLSESASKLATQSEVQFHLGMVQYMLGEEDLARVALQQAASSPDEFPGKEEANRRLAILAIDAKTADAKTKADLEKRLQDDPDDPVAASRLATVYERDGAFEKAAQTYEKTLKYDGQNAQIMGNLVQLYIRLNDYEKAMDMAKQAHKAAPEDPVISCILGRLVFRSGDYNWAASLLQEAAPKLPNEHGVQYDLAWAEYAVGRVNDAEAIMQNAARTLTAARLDDANRFLAMIAAAKNPTDAAATQAGQILKGNPDYVPALMVSAIQLERHGKPEEATSFYEKVLALYPGFVPAARNLAILYTQHPGDDQKAYDLALKARTALPDDAELARTLGVLAYRRGDYSRATQLLQECSQKLGKDGEILYYLGMSHYQLKQKAESKSELQRALTLNLESKLAEEARKTLAEMK